MSVCEWVCVRGSMQTEFPSHTLFQIYPPRPWHRGPKKKKKIHYLRLTFQFYILYHKKCVNSTFVTDDRAELGTVWGTEQVWVTIITSRVIELSESSSLRALYLSLQSFDGSLKASSLVIWRGLRRALRFRKAEQARQFQLGQEGYLARLCVKWVRDDSWLKLWPADWVCGWACLHDQVCLPPSCPALSVRVSATSCRSIAAESSGSASGLKK